MNLAARLCGEARPQGIIIHADGFPNWRPNLEHNMSFFYQKQKIKHIIEECNLWVSEEIINQILPREKRRSYIEVHVGTVCINPEKNEILVALRNKNRELYPKKWECGGGQIYENESIEEATIRSIRNEFGLKAKPIHPYITSFYSISHKNTIIPGIRILAKIIDTENNDPKISEQHDKATWVSFDDFLNSQRWPSKVFIEGAKDQIAELIHKYREKKT